MCRRPLEHYKMTTITCNWPWVRSAVLSYALCLVAIIGFALCAQSCRPSRQVYQEQTSMQTIAHGADSTIQEMVVRMSKSIPQDTVQTVVSLTSLRNLPKGAQYSARKGRASLKVSVRDSLVYVYASCDSLEQEIEYYRSLAKRTYDRYKSERMAHEATKSRASPPWWQFMLLGLALGIAGTIFIGIKLKHR